MVCGTLLYFGYRSQTLNEDSRDLLKHELLPWFPGKMPRVHAFVVEMSGAYSAVNADAQAFVNDIEAYVAHEQALRIGAEVAQVVAGGKTRKM